MMRHFNCVLPYLPPNKTQPVCKAPSNEYFRSTLNPFYDQATRNQDTTGCEKPCTKMDVSVVWYGGIPNHREKITKKLNTSSVKIFLKSTAQVTEIVPDYPLATLLAGTKNLQSRTRLSGDKYWIYRDWRMAGTATRIFCGRCQFCVAMDFELGNQTLRTQEWRKV